MTLRRTAAGLLACLALAACSDMPTTSPRVDEAPSLSIAPAAVGGLALPVTGTLPGGGTFAGTLTITQFAVNQAGQLLASGVLTGMATQGTTVTQITQTFQNVLIDVTQQGRRCRILFLDVGPIFLDVLGLQVSLSRIVLDITAVAGPGNLLGNLLCALVGLLDRNPLNLTAIQQLLNQINAILAGL